MVAVFAGRLVRWMLLALLVLKLGPGAVNMVAHHAVTALALVAVLVALAILGWWLKKRQEKTEARP